MNLGQRGAQKNRAPQEKARGIGFIGVAQGPQRTCAST